MILKLLLMRKGDVYVTRSLTIILMTQVFKRNCKQNNYVKYRNGKKSDDDDLFIEAKKQLNQSV